MTQPRTETADIVDELRRLADTNRGFRVSCNSELIDLSANRLEEQEATIHKKRDSIKEFERCISEDAAEIATLRKTISEQAATIERLRSKAELFDQLTRIE